MTIYESDLPTYGPGKFEGGPAINEVVHRMTLDACDDEIGSVDECGVWYGILRGDLSPTPDYLDGYELSEQEHEFLLQFAGAIVFEDSHGFVGVAYYESTGDLEVAWRECENEIEGIRKPRRRLTALPPC